MVTPSFSAFPVLCLLASVKAQGQIDPSNTPAPLTAEEESVIFGSINSQRRAVTPEAANEQCLSYSDTLATAAQTEADRCSFQSTDGTFVTYFEADTSAGTSVTAARPDPLNAPLNWLGGILSYTYDATGGTCSGTQIECDNYKQVIWAAASQIGCGITACSDMDGTGLKGYNVVCKFDVAGNTPNTPPYTAGTACSACGSLACNVPTDGSGNYCCAGTTTTATTTTGTTVSTTTVSGATAATTTASSTMCTALVPPRQCSTLFPYFYCPGFGSYCDTTTGQCCQGTANGGQVTVLPVTLASGLAPGEPAPGPAAGNTTSTVCSSGTVETNPDGSVKTCQFLVSPYFYYRGSRCSIGFTCSSTGLCCAAA